MKNSKTFYILGLIFLFGLSIYFSYDLLIKFEKPIISYGYFIFSLFPIYYLYVNDNQEINYNVMQT